jgi:hypothetical protein
MGALAVSLADEEALLVLGGGPVLHSQEGQRPSED